MPVPAQALELLELPGAPGLPARPEQEPLRVRLAGD